jgi:hypothetical protein
MRLKVAIIISKVDGHHEKEEALNLLCVMPGNLTKMEAAPVRMPPSPRAEVIGSRSNPCEMGAAAGASPKVAKCLVA